ncbi:MAG: putative Ig domain-containing protein, partial [Caldilineaceae bacterium]|nr:putative Ig domain-containing protein [Caldilineaceae bacterium]
NDGALDSNVATVTIAVNAVNHPPVIISTPVTVATAGQLYGYDVAAIDPEGDSLTFALVNAPAGMAIDPATGLLFWTPAAGQIGEYTATVRVEDTGGLSDEQVFTVTVLPGNHAPAIVSTPVTTASTGQPYNYDVDAIDPDVGDTLIYSLAVSPLGMIIEPTTGLISWTPAATQQGSQDITVRVTDSGGLFADQGYVVTVLRTNSAPKIVSNPVVVHNLGSCTDPPEPTWSLQAPMSTPRYYPGAAVLGGQLYVIGGCTTGRCGLDSTPTVEAYDPITNVWIPRASIGTSRSWVAAAEFQGRIYAVGGGNPDPLATLEMYDADVDAWVPRASMPTARVAPAASSIDGRLYVVGGYGRVSLTGIEAFRSLEVYDPIGDTWADKSLMPTARAYADAGVIDGKLYVVGGLSESRVPLGTLEVYDPQTDSWATLATMPTARMGPAVSTIDGRLYVVGGSTASSLATLEVYDTVEVYDPATNTWATLPPMPTPRYGSGTGIIDGRMHVVGGFTTSPVAVHEAFCRGVTPYIYNVEATDPDAGDTLTYSLVIAPAGMTIDSVTGHIDWTPSADQLGDYTVTVRVEDQGGLSDEQVFTVTALPGNHAPVITSEPPTCPQVGQLYSYDVLATDPDEDILAYSLPVAPSGMEIDPGTGVIRWTPTEAQLGAQQVVIRVQDNAGASADQSYSVEVVSAPGLMLEKSTTIGGAGDQASLAVRLSESNLVIAGYNNDGSGALLVAVDHATLDLNWTRTMPGRAIFNDVAIAPNDLYPVGSAYPPVCGANDSRGGVEYKSILARYSDAGDFLFCNSRTFYSYSGYEHYYAAVAVTIGDEPFIFATGGHQTTGFPSVFVLAKYNAAGELVSQAAEPSLALGLAQSNGALFAAGSRWMGDGSGENFRPVLAKFDLNPTLIWKVEAPEGQAGHFQDVTTLDEFIYTVGYLYEQGVANSEDYLIEKYDDSGNRLWRRTFGGPGSQRLREIVALKGRLFAVGSKAQPGSTNLDVVLLEIDPATGDLLNTQIYGGKGNDEGESVTSDGEALYITGTTGRGATDEGNIAGQKDILLLKYRLVDACQLRITTTPLNEAFSDLLYTYDVNAVGDSGELSYTLTSAPAGMVIDAATGIINWTPTSTQAGGNSVVVQVSDATGAFTTQSFYLDVGVASQSNHPPVITSTPITSASPDVAYSYPVTASDPDAGDTLTYSLTNAPGGMTIDHATGVVTWTPALIQLGTRNVTVRVSDTGGLATQQSFTITVTPPENRAPTITSLPPAGPQVGEPYSYDVEATDPDGDILTYSLPVAPAGMEIDPDTGLIQWTPAADQVGDNPITVRVGDGRGGVATQDFMLNVGLQANHPPVIDSAKFVTQWTQLTPTGTQPSPREFSNVNAYDAVNDRLIVFAGAPGGPHLNDVWVLAGATDLSANPEWIALSPAGTPPAGRIQHTAMYDPTANRLILYGGCGGNCLPNLSDTWVLTNANGIGGTPEWLALPSADARAGHVAGYDPVSNRMVIFGGHAGFPGGDKNDVRVLIDANGIGAPQWISLSPLGTPPPPRGEVASAAYDPISNRLIVYGGRSDTGGTLFGDVWVLSNANGLGGTPTWIQLAPVGTPPLPRGGHSVVYDPNSNRIIVFGGIVDLVNITDEAWALTNANGIGGVPEWVRLDAEHSMNLARGFHTVGYAGATNRMVAALGVTDWETGGRLLNDVWLLSNASGLCTASQLCKFQVSASDPDAGDTLTYSLDATPPSMSVDPVSGTIDWTPAPADTGNHPVTVRVTDSGGLSATHTFTATVAPVAVPNLVGLAPEWAESMLGTADLATGTKTSEGGAITLNFDSLPSRQGWTYFAQGNIAAEDSVFAVDGTTLFQDSLSVGFAGQGSNRYNFYNIVDRRLPVEMALRARVLEEMGNVEWNVFGFGFGFGFFTGTETMGIGIGATQLRDQRGSAGPMVLITGNDFHDYQLYASPGIGFELFLDGDLVHSGPTVPTVYQNHVSLGDGTGGTNARAEVTAYSYTQPRVVGQNPPAGTLLPNKTTVDFTIVEGPATETVPNLIRFTQAQASTAILAANLTVGAISFAPSNTIPAGQVSDQSPLPNIHVPKETPVNLVLSTGPAGGTPVPPVILSSPVLDANADQPYAYQVTAADANAGDTLNYSLPAAPAGMTIDPGTGLVAWTPTGAQVGSQSVTVRVTDQGGLFAEQSFTITVVPLENRVPTITSSPPAEPRVGQQYSYGVAATDPDNDVLTYSLPVAPAGMEIDPATGLIQWTPTPAQLGDNSVTVRVEDGRGGFFTQSFTLTVAPAPIVNEPPVITSGAITVVRARQLYAYAVQASDPNPGDLLSFALETAPAGMVIDAPSGLIQWVPLEDKVGDHTIAVRVTDREGLSDTQTFTLTVTPANRAPDITSVPLATARVGVLYTYKATASDPDTGDTLTYLLDAAPAGMTIDSASGLVQWVPTTAQQGERAVTLRVQDQLGAGAIQGFSILVGANHLPVITSTPVTTATAGQGYVYDVQAGDPDAGDLLTYALTTAPPGMSIDPVSGLIQWTPAEAQMGDHAVSVQVLDQGGLSATQVFTLTVAASPPPLALASIRIAPVTALALTGQAVNFTATGILPDGTSQGMAGIVSWTSSNPVVAGVDANGTAIANSAGTATLTARVGAVSAAATLTVLARVPNGTAPLA